jgi:hypothetical protein
VGGTNGHSMSCISRLRTSEVSTHSVAVPTMQSRYECTLSHEQVPVGKE